tara:strand:+ start:4376 stop:6328 length:1953 start_codon:yes stop_codon:yes gene_type:complete
MKVFLRISLKVFIALTLFFIFLISFFYTYKSIEKNNNFKLLGNEAPEITNGNRLFRDLNKNGKLDVYEDKTKPIDLRVEDLISQMNTDEKAGSVFINMIGVNKDGSIMDIPTFSDPFSFLMSSSSEMIIKLKMNHFNTRASHPKENMLIWYNSIQKVAEKTRLGIPITIASDPRHGVPTEFGASIYTPYFSKWPSALGMGAIGDSILVNEHAQIVRDEYSAIGIKVALGPMADIATEPRWTRVDGTFGENSIINAKLTAAYVKGLQGDSINQNSVISMVKHFPGSGPVGDGKDTHFPPGIQLYDGNNFEEHLIPFQAAFEAGAASVMPTYSILKGITSQDIGASFDKEIITGMLRNKLNFDGVICSDWGLITDKRVMGILFKPASAHGVESLNTDQRIKKIIDAGVNLIGGESLSLELARLIKDGIISEEIIDESLRKIMKQKFQLGLFDNPYIDKRGLVIYSNETNKNKGIEAQKRSIVLLKNENNILPLDVKTKIYAQGFQKPLNDKYKFSSIKDADINIIKLTSPKGEGIEANSIMQMLLEGGRLDFTKEQLDELMPIIKSKPTILVVNLKRPSILTELNDEAKALIADFDVSEELIFDMIFGEFGPSGKLPIQLPSSMQAVIQQKEDLPYDSKNSLYEYGHGLSYK